MLRRAVLSLLLLLSLVTPALAAREPKSEGGMLAPVQADPVLAAIVGPGPQTRGDITRKVNEYIKKRGLMDQNNKRMVNADDRLRAVFGGKDQASLFEVTALVNKHIKPFP